MPTNPLRQPPKPWARIQRKDTRENSNARGYGRRWRKYRLAYLAANPLCRRCGERGRTKLATVIDHIQPIDTEADPLFWREDNHQPLCNSCHSIKTLDDRAAKQTRKDR